MDRRSILQNVAVGMGIAAAGGLAVGDESSARAQSAPRGSHIEAADGAELYFKDWGAGRPVVFVHSWAANSDMWQYQMTPLSNDMRCVAYDRRGHGRSSQPGYGYDYDTLADDLADVLDQLDIRGATLIGHSMGGDSALAFAEMLNGENIPVSLLVTYDPSRIASDVPPNVERYINVYQSSNVMGGTGREETNSPSAS